MWTAKDVRRRWVLRARLAGPYRRSPERQARFVAELAALEAARPEGTGRINRKVRSDKGRRHNYPVVRNGRSGRRTDLERQAGAAAAGDQQNREGPSGQIDSRFCAGAPAAARRPDGAIWS